MASDNCILDIHICGACRSEFSDILKFIQHKKECYLSAARGQGQMPELSHLTGPCVQHHLHPSDGLELELPNTEFHTDAYPYSAVHSDHLENSDASQTSVQVSVPSVLTGAELVPDCARKDHGQFSYALNSPMVSEHKNLDVTTLYSYSWSADPDVKDESISTSLEHNVPENEPTIITDTSSYMKNSMNVETIVNESKNHIDISADNIAVYVMSPKSFASSVGTQSKYNHDSRSKSLSEFSAGSVWPESRSESDHQSHMLEAFTSVITSPSVNSKRSYINFNEVDQQNDLMYIHQQNTGSEIQKPVCSSGFYCDSELALGSSNSTPCPEDLEVGQISAAMFGKKNQQEDFKIVMNVNTAQAIPAASESLQDPCKTSFHNSSAIAQSDSYYKMLVDDVNNVHGYIEENTVNAPIIRQKKGPDLQSKRSISVEKRERLQGVSDDLLSSSAKFIPESGARGQGQEFSQKTDTQVSNGNIPSIQLPRKSTDPSSAATPSLTSYKAIFTSPSSGGHRLTATQAGLSESLNCSIQGFSSLKSQLFSRGSNSIVSKSIEYKNISASMQNQDRQSEEHLSHTDLSQLITEKKSDRQVQFETDVNQLTRHPNKQGLTLNHNLTLSTILGHSANVAEDNVNTSDEFLTHHSSVLTASLNTPLISSTNAQITVPTNKMQEHQHNTDLNIEMSVGNRGSHHEDDASVLVLNGLNVAQTYIGEQSSSDCHVNDISGMKIEIPMMAQKDCSQEVLSASCSNNNSIFMIYKDSEGSVIMVPKMFYSNAIQNSSQAVDAFQASRSSTSNTELSLENGSHNFQSNHIQQQVSESGVHHDVMNTSDNSPGISHHYYIQNLGTSFVNQAQILSNVDANTVLTSSEGSYIINQSTSMTPSTNHAKTQARKAAVTQRTQASSARHCETAALEKERYIIKPRKAEGSSKSPSANLEKSNRNVKRTVQTSLLKEHGVSGVTVRDDDKKSRCFTCKFDKCRYSTSLYKDFQRHCRRHTGEKPFQCMDCGKTFNRSDKLKIHERRHTGLKPFQCKICDYAAIEGGSLKKHMRIHTDERPFKCQICKYASRNSSQLIVHLRTHTGDSPFHCTKCTAKFKINSDLKRHMRIHTGEKPFKCDSCDYKSSNKGNLKTHMRINHLEENEIHCPVCKFVTSSKKRLREHEKTHSVQVIKCTQCDYTCANFGQLRSHIIIHNSLKPFRCNFCSYSSKQSGNLKKHVQNMHLYKMQAKSKNAASGSENEIKVQGTRRENVLLPIAERSNTHRRLSSASCRKLHTCEQCGSNFVREDSLRCHTKQHSTCAEEEKESKSQTQTEKSIADSHLSNQANTMSAAFYGHQGIQQIVAAASKIYEENYGLVNAVDKSFTENINSSASKLVPDVGGNHSVKHNQSELHNAASISVNEIRHKKSALQQVPWEHRSYTLTVSSDYKGPHPSHSSETELSSSTAQSKTQTHILKTKVQQNKCSKIHHKQPSPKDGSFRPPKRSPPKQQSLHVPKIRRVEKSLSTSKQVPTKPYQAVGQPTQETHLQQQETHQQLNLRQPTMSSDSINQLSGAETAVYLTQQGTDGSTGDSFYNIQLVPQFEASQIASLTQGTPELHHLSVGTMHIQLQPTAHIQIVMPGSIVPKSSHLVRAQGNPGMPQQQIVLQVQDRSEGSQVFTIPADSLGTVQTTGQVIPHILSSCTSQPNGQIGPQVYSITDSHAGVLGQSTNQIGENARNVVTGNTCVVSEIVQEAMRNKEDPQITVCS